jgi:hypothetical protein
MLQQQFGQVAAATAASMAIKPMQAEDKTSASPPKTAKKTAKKTATQATPKPRTKLPTKTSAKKTS